MGSGVACLGPHGGVSGHDPVNEGRAMPTPTPQLAFVLIRPQMGENIGAAARGMWNFGLDRMRVIAPRDGWPNPKAVAMASGAGRLLDEARDRKSTRLNPSHSGESRMPSSA